MSGGLDLPDVGGAAEAPRAVDIFDTTLRDGAQFEGISLTVEDKLRVAEQLDWLGVAWIEGGYPQANPKDAEFFRRAAAGELQLATATLVAFGSTRRPAGKVDEDSTLRALVEAGTSTACIVGKSWDFHVTEALGTTLSEGIAMVGESVRFLRDAGLRVFFDAEHFFDGYKANPEYALRVLEAAATNDAQVLVLCDTNGGSLPHEVQRITAEVTSYFEGTDIGIHTQNDSGCAVANSVAAVLGGASQVQGTVNGYGERTGNANLMTVIPDLTLKLGITTLPEGRMERLTAVSRHVAELVNLPPHPADPYVGSSAFAHKGGLHTSALGKVGGASYEHIDPSAVGNHTRVLVSDLGGRAGMSMKAAEFGVELDNRAAADLSERLKVLEAEGYVFEAADASLELLMRRATGWEHGFFAVEAYRVSSYHRQALSVQGDPLGDDGGPPPEPMLDLSTEATVKLWIGDDRLAAVGEGNGPVNALDAALRNALNGRYEALGRIHLTDFKVRVLDGATTPGLSDTGSVVRVLIDFTDGDRTWTTTGVSPNVIEASWQALTDGIVFGLLHAED
ncbi:citramalate synthase [Dermatobacter hominis]|uniref:citramalate synthase n=1 Tax=Dermatobacter hominis TaxID=2884263 RepID=UPI001D1178C0|nr:citramalate synthase [Dermatobacter hominis]UDY37068.1 citramalate synthase [Dermatobacter hominis]